MLVLLAVIGVLVSWGMWSKLEVHYKHDPYSWPDGKIESEAKRTAWLKRRNEYLWVLLGGVGTTAIAGFSAVSTVARGIKKRRTK